MIKCSGLCCWAFWRDGEKTIKGEKGNGGRKKVMEEMILNAKVTKNSSTACQSLISRNKRLDKKCTLSWYMNTPETLARKRQLSAHSSIVQT
jgi:hypothetical protein